MKGFFENLQGQAQKSKRREKEKEEKIAYV